MHVSALGSYLGIDFRAEGHPGHGSRFLPNTVGYKVVRFCQQSLFLLLLVHQKLVKTSLKTLEEKNATCSSSHYRRHISQNIQWVLNIFSAQDHGEDSRI